MKLDTDRHTWGGCHPVSHWNYLLWALFDVYTRTHTKKWYFIYYKERQTRFAWYLYYRKLKYNDILDPNLVNATIIMDQEVLFTLTICCSRVRLEKICSKKRKLQNANFSKLLKWRKSVEKQKFGQGLLPQGWFLYFLYLKYFYSHSARSCIKTGFYRADESAKIVHYWRRG